MITQLLTITINVDSHSFLLVAATAFIGLCAGLTYVTSPRKKTETK